MVDARLFLIKSPEFSHFSCNLGGGGSKAKEGREEAAEPPADGQGSCFSALNSEAVPKGGGGFMPTFPRNMGRRGMLRRICFLRKNDTKDI